MNNDQKPISWLNYLTHHTSSVMDPSYIMRECTRRRLLRTCIVVITLFTTMVSFGWIPRLATTPATLMTTATRLPSGFSSVTARVVKVSMLYGASNSLYERALVTHRKHAERWGHRFQVLREDITSGFWNKPAFILYSVIEELSKPSDDRAEWLM